MLALRECKHQKLLLRCWRTLLLLLPAWGKAGGVSGVSTWIVLQCRAWLATQVHQHGDSAANSSPNALCEHANAQHLIYHLSTQPRTLLRHKTAQGGAHLVPTNSVLVAWLLYTLDKTQSACADRLQSMTTSQLS